MGSESLNIISVEPKENVIIEIIAILKTSSISHEEMGEKKHLIYENNREVIF